MLQASILRENIYLISNIFNQDAFLPHTTLMGAAWNAELMKPGEEELGWEGFTLGAATSREVWASIALTSSQPRWKQRERGLVSPTRYL